MNYMEIRDALDQIKLNLDALFKFLFEIENCITFGRLGILHPSIISIEEISQQHILRIN